MKIAHQFPRAGSSTNKPLLAIALSKPSNETIPRTAPYLLQHKHPKQSKLRSVDRSRYPDSNRTGNQTPRSLVAKRVNLHQVAHPSFPSVNQQTDFPTATASPIPFGHHSDNLQYALLQHLGYDDHSAHPTARLTKSPNSRASASRTASFLRYCRRPAPSVTRQRTV
jgi:hypothetical protein